MHIAPLAPRVSQVQPRQLTLGLEWHVTSAPSSLARTSHVARPTHRCRGPVPPGTSEEGLATPRRSANDCGGTCHGHPQPSIAPPRPGASLRGPFHHLNRTHVWSSCPSSLHVLCM